jgi:hypothetical protein
VTVAEAQNIYDLAVIELLSDDGNFNAELRAEYPGAYMIVEGSLGERPTAKTPRHRAVVGSASANDVKQPCWLPHDRSIGSDPWPPQGATRCEGVR